jgi:preprotein translocase subunit YajC
VFATQAQAQTPAGAAAPAGGGMQSMMGFALPVLMIVLFYVLIMRPQQKRVKQHQAMINAVKRGDEVVLSSGIKGKVTKVEEADATVEIAPGVSVRVVKSMLSDVRTRGEPAAANDLVK